MKNSRRDFLGYGIAVAATAGSLHGAKKSTASGFLDILRQPDLVTAYGEELLAIRLQPSGGHWRARDIELRAELRQEDGSRTLALSVSAPQTALTRIHLRWAGKLAENLLFLGDQWERSYGDLAWRSFDGNRAMPWYFIATDRRQTYACGVKTGANAFCFWQTDQEGISLWLDIRNGGSGVRLGERRLAAAEVVTEAGSPGDTAFQTTRALCRKLCTKVLLPKHAIYGSNNWYYLYGKNMTAENVMMDVDQLATLAPAGANRPYMVIDMGWGKAPDGAGPWTQENSVLPDIPGLVAKIRARNVRPAIWIRPLLTVEPLPKSWQLDVNRLNGPFPPPEKVIDPSVPAALQHIQDGLRRITGWGFELIKHDFSTFDLLGRWGFQMGPELTSGGWHFADRSKTTAEIIAQLYWAIRKAIGNTPLLGCNTVGHLGAGIFEMQRIANDVSSQFWSRTRKMGVNGLGFRLPQHRTFFLADPDCVTASKTVPFEMAQQWSELVSQSGAVVFISANPATATAQDKRMLKSALAAAAKTQPGASPLDWMETVSPRRWKLQGRSVNFNWFGKEGDDPFSK